MKFIRPCTLILPGKASHRHWLVAYFCAALRTFQIKPIRLKRHDLVSYIRTGGTDVRVQPAIRKISTQRENPSLLFRLAGKVIRPNLRKVFGRFDLLLKFEKLLSNFYLRFLSIEQLLEKLDDLSTMLPVASIFLLDLLEQVRRRAEGIDAALCKPQYRGNRRWVHNSVSIQNRFSAVCPLHGRKSTLIGEQL